MNFHNKLYFFSPRQILQPGIKMRSSLVQKFVHSRRKEIYRIGLWGQFIKRFMVVIYEYS
jgi:hypothetical protein